MLQGIIFTANFALLLLLEKKSIFSRVLLATITLFFVCFSYNKIGQVDVAIPLTSSCFILYLYFFNKTLLTTQKSKLIVFMALLSLNLISLILPQVVFLPILLSFLSMIFLYRLKYKNSYLLICLLPIFLSVISLVRIDVYSLPTVSEYSRLSSYVISKQEKKELGLHGVEYDSNDSTAEQFLSKKEIISYFSKNISALFDYTLKNIKRIFIVKSDKKIIKNQLKNFKSFKVIAGLVIAASSLIFLIILIGSILQFNFKFVSENFIQLINLLYINIFIFLYCLIFNSPGYYIYFAILPNVLFSLPFSRTVYNFFPRLFPAILIVILILIGSSADRFLKLDSFVKFNRLISHKENFSDPDKYSTVGKEDLVKHNKLIKYLRYSSVGVLKSSKIDSAGRYKLQYWLSPVLLDFSKPYENDYLIIFKGYDDKLKISKKDRYDKVKLFKFKTYKLILYKKI